MELFRRNFFSMDTELDLKGAQSRKSFLQQQIDLKKEAQEMMQEGGEDQEEDDLQFHGGHHEDNGDEEEQRDGHGKSDRSKKKRKKKSKKKKEDGCSHEHEEKEENQNIVQNFSNNVQFANLRNLDDIISKLSTRLCKPEDMVISRGSDGDNIFFLIKGTIEIYIDDPRQGKVEDEYFELE